MCRVCPGWPPRRRFRRLPPPEPGRGGLTMSLEGGLEEVEEFFFSRATSASSSAIRASSGATAASINSRTSSSVNIRAMTHS